MKGLIAKLALVSMLACAATSWAYFPYGYFKKDGSGFIPVRYDLTKLPNSTLTFHINADRLWLLPDNHPQAALFADLKAALDAWNVSNSALRLKPGGFTHLTRFNGPAGLVSFTPEIAPGIAVIHGYETGPLPTDDSVAFIPLTASFVKLPHLVDELGAYGLLNALSTGIGGSIGLNNSHIMGALTQVVYTNNRGRLSPDDVAGISSLYPTDNFDKTTGELAGWVTGPKGPVALGAVTAYNDSAAIGTYTNPDGSFLIRGLPPGSYRLFIQPLMGGLRGGVDKDPNLLGPQTKLGGGAVKPSLDFGACFLAILGESELSESNARALDVAAGTRVYARIWGVPARGTYGIDAYDAISNLAGGAWVPSIWVQQGGQVPAVVDAHKMVQMLPDPATKEKVKTVVVQVGFTGWHEAGGPGLTASNLDGTVDASDSAPWYDSTLSFTVSATPQARPGIQSVIYVAYPPSDKPGPPELYFSAGYVHVVPGAQAAGVPPRVTSISPTSGVGGTAITITGSGFNDFSKVFFDGLPATVVSRSPTSLVVTAPRGAAGHGSGIFVINADGQGSDFFVNAGVTLVDGRPKDLTNLVRFTYDPAIPAPSIVLAPTSVNSGQRLLIQVVGTNTHFVQDGTFAGFGSGDVIVNSMTVSSPTSLAADITVNAKIGEGFPVTVVTGEEVAFLQSAFRVSPAPPITLQVVSGNGQTGLAGSKLPAPLVVMAQDAAGGPLAGITVTFTVQAGGGTVSPTSAITDAKGLASTVLTLGPAAGFNAVVASADQFQSVGFVLAAGGASAASLRVTSSGDGQTAPAGQDLPNPLVLTILDALTNRRLAGLPVTWRVTSGGGVVTPMFTLTDASGTAAAQWTLGPTTGSQALEASISGFSPIVFKADAQSVAAAPSVPTNGVLNAAGLDTVSRSISPGGLVSIFGSGLFPSQTGASPGFWPGTDQIRTLFGGTEVTFDGVRAPILYASNSQLNVQVPFEVGGKSTVQMVVTVGGTRSNSVALDVQPATPGLFTMNSTGRGAAVALNQDNSRNSASSPVSRGQLIQLFGTGLGSLAPSIATGRVAPSGALLPLAVYVPKVTIGGSAASVEYAGLAPGYVGLWQVNVRVPWNAPTGEQPVVLETWAQRSNIATVFVR
jgi:uncharacterized protein (TIGR03437 family)